MNETIHAAGLEFELRRSSRRTTLGLTVDRGGDLLAHAPEEVELDEITDYINSRLLWVHQKLAEKEPLRLRHRVPEFITGETIYFLGNSHRLRVTEDAGYALTFDGTAFVLSSRIKEPFQHFRKWFIAQATPLIQRRVEWFQHRTTARPRKLRVCDLGFRWGSCGGNGNLNFNWQLAQLPMRLIDYVVAHEMVHLTIPDHSNRFWKAMSAIMPDYKERRDEIAVTAHRFLRFSAIPETQPSRK
jgi:predicted metal-dependent hydrolase